MLPMGKFVRPARVYDFTAFSRRTPAQQLPGDRVDAQFSAHADAIAELQAALARVEAKLQDLEASARGAIGGDLEGRPLYYGAGGPYATDVLGATSTSADYAQVSIDWAEHMPDTIPPGTLAINAISGDHWSSRWWANRAASAFGMMAWWYLGAWPSPGPPSTPNTPTGQPIPVGGMYYNINSGVMMAWNGTTWANAFAPTPATMAPPNTYYYLAAAGQTVFPLGVTDRHGRTFAFNLTTPEGLNAYVNGVRLEPVYDYAVNVSSSTVTFLQPLPAGALAAFDILTPAP